MARRHFAMTDEEPSECGREPCPTVTIITDWKAVDTVDCKTCLRNLSKDEKGWSVRARWTRECSGCSCDCGDGYGCSHGAGGCDECGYTGKRREEMWIPLYDEWAESGDGATND